MNTKLTDFTEKELGYMLDGVLDRKQTLLNLIDTINKYEDLHTARMDDIPEYESEIESLKTLAVQLSTAKVYVRDRQRAILN